MRALRLVTTEKETARGYRARFWLGTASLAALAVAGGMGHHQAASAARVQSDASPALAGMRLGAGPGALRGDAAAPLTPSHSRDGGGAREAAAAPHAERTSPADPVLFGRQLVINHDCGGCHGGFDNPAADGWLVGVRTPQQVFRIGPCAADPAATPCFRTYPRNLTPDNATGLGRFSERQIFNALRYGLRPGETPDVEITSNVPGQGNFPRNPKYLAPPMPWPAFRHMSDEELQAIAAYLKRGLAPVSNRVPDSEGPPDFWAGEYTLDKIGRYPSPAFPTTNERRPD